MNQIATTFIIGCHAIIKKDDKVLITRRAAKVRYKPGHFDFPGGHVEPGETPNETIEREIKEETELQTKIGNIEYVFTDREKVSERQYFQLLFNCEYVDGEVILNPNEHDEYRWATIEGLEGLPLIHFVEDWIQRQKKQGSD